MKPKRKTKSKARDPQKLTRTELDRMSAEFDREFVADEFGPPSPATKERLRRAKRKRGRPRIAEGAKAISVTVEKSLLRKIDRLVRLRKTTRAHLVARGLRAVLRQEEREAS